MPRRKPTLIYLIHFEKPLSHARHYLGITNNLDRRIQQHLSGTGSPLIKAVNAQGIAWKVVRKWEPGDYAHEKLLKARKHSPRLCPICRGEAYFGDFVYPTNQNSHTSLDPYSGAEEDEEVLY